MEGYYHIVKVDFCCKITVKPCGGNYCLLNLLMK